MRATAQLAAVFVGAYQHAQLRLTRTPLCAGTITNAAKVLHAEGAREVYACATHAVFSPPAVERLSSGVFQVAAPATHPCCRGPGHTMVQHHIMT